ncbi:MAG: D-alanine--D-alanine ligase family protein [Nitriliruptoraceae bacterium]
MGPSAVSTIHESDTGRRRVVVLYGGRSSEHSISCLSARSVLAAVDRDRYDVFPIGITRAGRWTLTDGVIAAGADALPVVADDGPTAALVGTRRGPLLVELDDDGERVDAHGVVDVVFPVLHGPWGEDGTVQGMLATVGVPFVGADVTASSIGIDKAAMKATFAASGLEQTDYLTVHRAGWTEDRAFWVAEIRARLDPPWFVKPTRQGSSIGISRVDDPAGLDAALAEAYEHDDVAVIEEGVVDAREIEVGILGDEPPHVTAPGEIVPAGDFYDFDAKYQGSSRLIIPAEIDPHVDQTIRALAADAYRAIGCRGLARVDFFLTADGQVLLNEINTIPGFTEMSMFPRLWAAEGLDYPALVDRLLDDALGNP